MEIVSQRENRLLSRLEVRFLVRYEKGTTPSRREIQEGLTDALKLKKGAVVVDHVRSEFGRRQASGYAKVYESVENARQLERPHILRRNGMAEGGE